MILSAKTGFPNLIFNYKFMKYRIHLKRIKCFALVLKKLYWFSTANWSLYCHVCCVPVSFKADRVGIQLGAWQYSDLLAILYI